MRLAGADTDRLLERSGAAGKLFSSKHLLYLRYRGDRGFLLTGEQR